MRKALRGRTVSFACCVNLAILNAITPATLPPDGEGAAGTVRGILGLNPRLRRASLRGQTAMTFTSTNYNNNGRKFLEEIMAMVYRRSLPTGIRRVGVNNFRAAFWSDTSFLSHAPTSLINER